MIASRLFLNCLLAACLTLCAACGYDEQDVAFSGRGAKLSGTLYLPAGEGPHPAIVFVHGSGPDSREQYRFYGDLFARKGYAALIYDKRGVGSSTGDWTRSPFDALVGDAEAGVRFLQGHPGIDPKRIGMWGGSEGAIVAAWAAGRTPGIAFILMQSATGVPFAEQNLHQTLLQMRALRLPPGEIAEAMVFQRLKHGYARTGAGWPEYAAALAASRDEPWASLGGPDRADDWWWRWYRTKMDVDPRPLLEQVRVPVFAIWGGRDDLVPVAQSRAIVARALAGRPGRDVRLLVVPEADHSLNTPQGPNPAPAYLDAMFAWLAERVPSGETTR